MDRGALATALGDVRRHDHAGSGCLKNPPLWEGLLRHVWQGSQSQALVVFVRLFVWLIVH